ncbi:SNF2-related protein [Uliginosibacterium gangwonense]|uniref:SNF2-related protein n=1 Tax=Uliginosibacterium gangwonense TaxID=392736 RepID=UPI00037D3CE9|nr:SNF2-related protein [Uliginosibacterium gangwonense]
MNAKDARSVKPTSITPTLYAHQKQSVKFMKPRLEVFDMSDPGTGKTGCEIEDFAPRRRKGAPPAIILATKSLLTSAWQEDFNLFAPDMRVSVAWAENREEAFVVEADAYITNHDGAKWLAKQNAKFWKRFEGGTYIIDESTAFKHHTSQRGKAAAKIRKHFEYARLMSGTPAPNGILDLWHQMLILDGGKRLGNSYYKFRNAACVPEQAGPMPNMIRWMDREGIEQTIAALLKDITIRHRFEDCVDIPPNTIRRVGFKLSARHMRLYKEMENFQLLELKDKRITAVNGAAVYTKLLQIASGAVYDQEHIAQLIDTDRYELVLDLVEERPHSMVFFLWQHQRDALVEHAKKRGLTFAVYDGSVSSTARTQTVKDFQAGALRVLFAHPQSAGHGLTLTKGTATIWASPTHNLEHFLQGLKRIYRIGQTERTETIVVCADDTWDNVVWEDKCLMKNARNDRLMDELKRMAHVR